MTEFKIKKKQTCLTSSSHGKLIFMFIFHVIWLLKTSSLLKNILDIISDISVKRSLCFMENFCGQFPEMLRTLHHLLVQWFGVLLLACWNIK